MIYDPGDCVYNINVSGININNQQTLGDAIIQLPLGGNIGATLQTIRKIGAGATGVYNKYHKRMHTDFFYVTIIAS